MLELHISVDGVAIDPRAAAPTLVFALHVAADEPVHALLLRTRIAIDAPRRRYDTADARRLTELFGERAQWAQTLRLVPWLDVSTAVPGFEGATTVAVPAPCTYDMEVAAAKYLHGVRDGTVPLDLAFTGTAFVRGPAGIGVVQLPHDLGTSWSMPAGIWHELMDSYHPGARWLRLTPERFDALARYKAQRAQPSWDATVDDLLARVDAGDPAEVGP